MSATNQEKLDKAASHLLAKLAEPHWEDSGWVNDLMQTGRAIAGYTGATATIEQTEEAIEDLKQRCKVLEKENASLKKADEAKSKK